MSIKDRTNSVSSVKVVKCGSVYNSAPASVTTIGICSDIPLHGALCPTDHSLTALASPRLIESNKPMDSILEAARNAISRSAISPFIITLNDFGTYAGAECFPGFRGRNPGSENGEKFTFGGC